MTVLIRMNDETIDAYSMRADKEIYRLTDLVKEMRKSNTEQREKIKAYQREEDIRIGVIDLQQEKIERYEIQLRNEKEQWNHLEGKLVDTESLVDSLRICVKARDEVIDQLKTNPKEAKPSLNQTIPQAEWEEVATENRELAIKIAAHELTLLKFRIIIANLTVQLYDSKEAHYQATQNAKKK